MTNFFDKLFSRPRKEIPVVAGEVVDAKWLDINGIPRGDVGPNQAIMEAIPIVENSVANAIAAQNPQTTYAQLMAGRANTLQQTLSALGQQGARAQQTALHMNGQALAAVRVEIDAERRMVDRSAENRTGLGQGLLGRGSQTERLVATEEILSYRGMTPGVKVEGAKITDPSAKIPGFSIATGAAMSASFTQNGESANGIPMQETRGLAQEGTFAGGGLGPGMTMVAATYVQVGPTEIHGGQVVGPTVTMPEKINIKIDW